MKKISIFLVSIILIAGAFPFITTSTAIKQQIIENQQSPVSNDWWEMFRHEPTHLGFSSSTAPEDSTILWSYQTGDTITSSPVVSHGRVYIGSWDYNIYCFEMDTGALIWSYTTDSMITATPVVSNGKIYVGSQDSYLYCLNAITGDFIWSFKTNYLIESSPTIKDGKIYFGTGDGYLYCLDENDGTLIWEYYTQNVIWSSPALTDDYVYFGNLNGDFYCLTINTGGLVWTYTTPSGIWSSPAVSDGKVYFGGNDYNIYCLNALTGSLVWNYTTTSEVHSSPAIAYNNVYIGTSEGKLYCLNKETGELVWSYQLINGAIWSQPSVADGKVYFGNDPCCGFTAYLYCLDAYTGSLIWSHDFQNFVGMKSSPAIAAGKVFVGAGDGKIYTFGEIQYLADANGPYYAIKDTQVQFTGSVYGGVQPFTWYWEFGDGAISNEQNPTHIYTQEGQYEVLLTVTDGNSDIAVDETTAYIEKLNSPPSIPEISGPTQGNINVEYEWVFMSIDPDGDDITYLIQWGGGCAQTYVGPHPSGQEVPVKHTYVIQGPLSIYAKAIDPYGAESDWGIFDLTMPRNRLLADLLLQRFLQRFENVFSIAKLFLNIK